MEVGDSRHAAGQASKRAGYVDVEAWRSLRSLDLTYLPRRLPPTYTDTYTAACPQQLRRGVLRQRRQGAAQALAEVRTPPARHPGEGRCVVGRGGPAISACIRTAVLGWLGGWVSGVGGTDRPSAHASSCITRNHVLHGGCTRPPALRRALNPPIAIFPPPLLCPHSKSTCTTS
jgi:hypothetical protein